MINVSVPDYVRFVGDFTLFFLLLVKMTSLATYMKLHRHRRVYIDIAIHNTLIMTAVCGGEDETPAHREVAVIW